MPGSWLALVIHFELTFKVDQSRIAEMLGLRADALSQERQRERRKAEEERDALLDALKLFFVMACISHPADKSRRRLKICKI